MKKRIFALFLSALLLTTVLCACGDEKSEEAGGIGSNGTSSSGEPVTGGELVVGISQDLGDSLDPYQMTAAGTREVLFNVYEGLVKPNVSGEYVPAVASDSTVSEDGLTYTFPLREGVLFHNGEAVTAEDVSIPLKPAPRPRWTPPWPRRFLLWRTSPPRGAPSPSPCRKPTRTS